MVAKEILEFIYLRNNISYTLRALFVAHLGFGCHFFFQGSSLTGMFVAQ